MLAAMFTTVAGCNRGGGSAEQQPDKPKATPAAVHTEVQVTVHNAERKNISDTANITGTLGALNDVVVGIKNSGKITAVYVREGDPVKKGQVLAEQDTADINSQIASARANLRSAQLRLDQAEAAISSAVTNLKITQSTTASAADQAQASLKAAQDSLVLLKKGARAQEIAQSQRAVEAATADLDSARADAKQAASDQQRYQSLHTQRAISDQQLQQSITVKAAADARVRAATARLESARQALSLLKEGAQNEDIHRSEQMVDQAQQALKSAETNRTLVEIRKADVASAKAAIDTAKAGVVAANAQLNISEQMLRDSIIRSPIDGVVAERKVEPGAQLSTVKPDVMRIVSLDSLFFDGQVPQSRFGDVRVGMPVTVQVDALPNKDIAGTVTRIFPVASPTARTFTLRVALSNSTGKLRPQMFARGKLTLGVHRNVITVPREAVIDVQESSPQLSAGAVYVVKDGKAVKKKITLGYVTILDDEITSGLEPGEIVVTVGQGQIQDGDAVKPSTAVAAP